MRYGRAFLCGTEGIIIEKNKKAACWALIIILLPYIVTVFVNGPKIVTASKVDEMTIDVKGGGKMPVEKYCIGILARDMPAEYEEEALKAQAILVRTEVYRAIRDAGEGQKLEKEFWTEKQMKSAWGMRYAENYRKLKMRWNPRQDKCYSMKTVWR